VIVFDKKVHFGGDGFGNMRIKYREIMEEWKGDMSSGGGYSYISKIAYYICLNNCNKTKI